jgi:hypothetical protein
MKRRLEDEAARLAFGDISPQEAEKLRQKLSGDRHAEAVFQTYADMRDGLKSLSEIPEDQFSRDRLRDAILTQGLKPIPTRVRSNRNWLWMPATASAMGFVLMFSVRMLHSHSGPTNIVVNPPKGYAIGSAIVRPNIVASNADSKARVGGIAKPSHSGGSDVRSVSFNPDEVDPRILATSFDATGEDASIDPDLGSRPALRNGSAPAGNVASNGLLTASTTASRVATSEPIVLIEQDKDDQTGACRATEVSSVSNVLVGG